MANYKALAYTDDVISICQPLTELGIHAFSFVRYFSDSSFIALISRPDWGNYFLNKKHYEACAVEWRSAWHHSGIVLWSCIPESQVKYDARNYFDIDNGICLHNKHENFCDIFDFASTKDNCQIQNFYLNNIDFLKKFTMYFKNRADGLIKTANIYKINGGFNYKEDGDIRANSEIINKNKVNHLKKQFKLNKFSFSNELGDSYLTARECVCVSWLIMGKTLAETGMILGISSKTVEEHIEHVKKKLNCYKQTTLVYKLCHMGFDPHLFL